MFTRAHKRFVASLLALGFLFSQFAVVAYACSAAFDTVAAAAEDATSTFIPCEEMNMEEMIQTDEPLRCLEHCKYGQQNFNSIAPVDIPQGTAVMLFELPLPTQSSISTAAFVQPALLAHTTSPPPFAARSLRLRI